MTAAQIPAILLIEAHYVSGFIARSGQRLLEVLNDPYSQFTKLTDATLQAFGETPAVQLPEATIPKPRIVVCALTATAHEAPDKRRFAFVEKRKHKAFVMAQNYEIRGILSLKGPAEAVGALGQELNSYFPLTDATIRHAPSNRVLKVMVAIVNKQFVSMLQLGNLECDGALEHSHERSMYQQSGCRVNLNMHCSTIEAG
jgi:hypothetical protein